MPENLATALDAFHFLRPAWLLALVPVALVAIARVRREDVRRAAGRLVAPHLVDVLLVGAERRGVGGPATIGAASVSLIVLAIAGPAWRAEPSPFAEDVAPVVAVIEVTETMNAIDIAPSRLERAKQKVRDLVDARPGARTALVAYAGTAHTVLPLTEDADVLASYLDALSTDVMPEPGEAAVAALQVARGLLAGEAAGGSVVLVTDGVPEDQVAAFTAQAGAGSDRVIALVVGTERGGPVRDADGEIRLGADGASVTASVDAAALRALGEQGIRVERATVDDGDVRGIARLVESSRERRDPDAAGRWRDEGYWLVWPAAALGLLGVRRGGAVLVLALGVGGCAPGSSEPRFADLWWTPDQQARRLFEAGGWAAAAERFEDPAWRGVAAARAGDWESAVAEFARGEGADAAYNLANALVHLDRLEPALASYDRAISLRPDWEDAAFNRALVAAEIEARREDPDEDEGPPPDPTFAADQVEFDEKGKEGKEGEVPEQALSDEQMADLWLRRIQTTPADFLRTRFAVEAAHAAAPPGTDGATGSAANGGGP